MVDVQDDGFIYLATNKSHGVKHDSLSIFAYTN